MRRVKLLLLMGALALGSCFAPTERDGVIACGTDGECPPGFACFDGLCWRDTPEPADAADDDGPSDSPDASPPDAALAACDDGIDNDCDGKIDEGQNGGEQDHGCSDEDDTSELGTRECDDGIDNDGDGFIDYRPRDSTCEDGDSACDDEDDDSES